MDLDFLRQKLVDAGHKKRQEDEISAEDYASHLKLVDAATLETVPRQTIITMLRTTKLNENFTFKTERKNGRMHMLAMRAVLSRVRNNAERDNVPLDEFKLYVVSIVTHEMYDEVTLVRTKSEAMLGRSLYSDIFAELAPASKK